MVLQGYDELMARFAAVKGGIAGNQLMSALGNSAVREQKLLFAPHTKTGTTVRSIMLGAVTPTSAQTRVGFAGPFIELGTRPHIIKPKNAKVLAWGGARRLSGALRKGAQATNFAMHRPPSRLRAASVHGARRPDSAQQVRRDRRRPRCRREPLERRGMTFTPVIPSVWETDRQDLNDALGLMIAAFQAVQPDVVRKAWSEIPASYTGETPLVYLGDIVETIQHTPAIQWQEFTGQIGYVDTSPDNQEANERANTFADFFRELFKVNYHLLPRGYLQQTGLSEAPATQGPLTGFMHLVLTFTFTVQEGRDYP